MAKAKAGDRAMKRGADEGTMGGFTIIEVVLVLAIAGLIFLMVFIALPALQRSQRDTQRRDDLARVTDAIAQFQTNNNGRLPSSDKFTAEDVNVDTGLVPISKCGAGTGDACRLVVNYLNGANAANNEFTDPDGPGYNLTVVNSADDVPASLDYNEHRIYVAKKSYCDGETARESSNVRDYAVLYRLEGAGTYCQDNGGGAAGTK